MGASMPIQPFQFPNILAAVDALPIGVHLLAGAGFVAGLILWLAGAKVVQAALVVLGSLAGAAVGSMVAPALLDPTIFGMPSVYVGLAAGSVLGLILGLAVFKFAMGVSGGVAFAILGVVVALITLARTPNALPQPEQAPFDAVLADIKTRGDALVASLSADKSAGAENARKIQTYAEEVRENIRARWQVLPQESKKMILLCAGGGFMLGLLLGLAAPVKLAALVTSLLGSAAVLIAGSWLVNAMNPELAAKLTPSPERFPLVAGCAWAALTIVGLGVQWQSGGKPAAKPAAPAQPPAA